MSAAFDEAFDFDAFDLDITGADLSSSIALVTACTVAFAAVTVCSISAERVVTACAIDIDLATSL